MTYVQWGDYLVLGIKEIDEQHHRLVDIINKLYSAIFEGYPQVVVSEILAELMNYATVHFRDEEKFFESYNYPKNEEHIKQHQEFAQRVIAYQNDLSQGKTVLLTDMLSFLTEWLTNHIQGMDREYADYLRHIKAI